MGSILCLLRHVQTSRFISGPNILDWPAKQFFRGYFVVLSMKLKGDGLKILLSSILLICAAVSGLESPSSKLLDLRGGFLDRNIDPLYQKVEMVDRITEATSLLNNMKVPAALIAGQSLAAAFAKFDYKGSPYPPRQLEDAYRWLICSALFMELCVVFTATTMSWRLLGGGFDPIHKSAPALLMKYFDFEYLSVITLFLGGIICMVLAIALRTIAFFGSDRFISDAIAILSAWVAYYFVLMFHHSMVSFDDGLIGLIPHVAKRTLEVVQHLIFEGHVFFLSYSVAVYAIIKYIKNLCSKHADIEQAHTMSK